MLEKTLESPLDCKEIQPVHPKGDQSWVFIGRTDADAEAESPKLWPPDVKNWLIGEDPDSGKDWKQEEKRITEDEMVGYHQSLSNSRSWWWKGRPGVLWFLGLQRVIHGWESELKWERKVAAWGNVKIRNLYLDSTNMLLLLLSRFSRVWLCATP